MLVIAATWAELEPLSKRLTDDQDAAAASATSRHWPEKRTGRVDGFPVVVTAAGIGKANTAAAIAALCASGSVGAVVQLGIGGAYPAPAGGQPLPIGSLAVAASEFDLDLGLGVGATWLGLESLGFPAVATDPPTFNRVAIDAALAGAVAASSGWPVVPFATSDSVTTEPLTAKRIAAEHGVMIESMEGAAAAQVCLALGLPFIEIRAVSNDVGERDKGKWKLREAVAAAATAASTALPTVYAYMLAESGYQ